LLNILGVQQKAPDAPGEYSFMLLQLSRRWSL